MLHAMALNHEARAHAIVDSYIAETTWPPPDACPLTRESAAGALDERIPWEEGPGPDDALVDACFAAVLARWKWHVARVPSRWLDEIERAIVALEQIEAGRPLAAEDRRRAIDLGVRLGVRPPPL